MLRFWHVSTPTIVCFTYLARLTVAVRGLDAGDGVTFADVDAFAPVLRATICATLHGACWCGELACGTARRHSLTVTMDCVVTIWMFTWRNAVDSSKL